MQMQQNVQSQLRDPYSQRRNSIPSKHQKSQQVMNNNSLLKQNKIQWQGVYIDGKYYLADENTLHKLREIQAEIQKEKQLISNLKKEQRNAQNDNDEESFTKSYLSLQQNEIGNVGGEASPFIVNSNSIGVYNDTKTQIQANNASFLDDRKQKAIIQLQQQENKYRENIIKMQIKRSIMKKQLKQDKKDLEIEIKVMDLGQLDNKRKQANDSPSREAAVQSQKNQQNQNSSPEVLVKQSSEILLNKSKVSNKQSENKKQIKQSENNQSRSPSTKKKYSVKKSSVIVPQINDSIKQIQQRRASRLKQKSLTASKVSKISKTSQISQKLQQKKEQYGAVVSQQNLTQKQSNKLKQPEIVAQQNVIQNQINEFKQQKQLQLEQFSQKQKSLKSQKKQADELKLNKDTIKGSPTLKQSNLSKKSSKAESMKKQDNSGSVKASVKLNQQVQNEKSDKQSRVQDQQSPLIQQSEKSMNNVQKSQKNAQSVKKSVHKDENSEKQKFILNDKQQQLNEQKAISVVQASHNKAQSHKSQSIIKRQEQSKLSNKSVKNQSVSSKKSNSSKLSAEHCQAQQKVSCSDMNNNNFRQATQKSFKKKIVDQSIQWSQVDMSMYGKTQKNNQNLNNQSSYQSLADVQQVLLNQQSNERMMKKSNNKVLQQQQEKVVEAQQIQNQKSQKVSKQQCSSKVSESKNKKQINNKNEQISSLKPSEYNQQKSKKTTFVLRSREGSVKQKTERYQNFKREHSLRQKKDSSSIAKQHKQQKISEHKKLINAKQLLLTPIDLSPTKPNMVVSGGKAVSYRSRKSSKVNNHSQRASLQKNKNQARTVINNKSTYKTIDKEELKGNKGNKIEIKQKQKQQSIDSQLPQSFDENIVQGQKSRLLVARKDIEALHQQIKLLELKLNKIQSKQQGLLKQKQQQKQKAQLQKQQIQNQNNEQKAELQQNKQNQEKQLQIKADDDIPAQQNSKVQQNKVVKEEQNPKNKSQQNVDKELSEKEEENINKIVEQKQPSIEQNKVEPNYIQQKDKLMDQISRLRRIIRDLQIQKIKSIEYAQDDNNSDKNKNKQQSQIGGVQNEEQKAKGFIIHQLSSNNPNNNDSQVIQQKVGDVSDVNKSKISRFGQSAIGKIVKNSPQKSPQRKNSISPDKRGSFRINLSKKTSNLQNNQFIGKSSELMSPIIKKNSNQQSQKQFPLAKKNESHFLQNSNQIEFPSKISQIHPLDRNNSRRSDCNETSKQVILEKFHKTNRQFHQFVESSRVINETNSSISESHTQNQFLNQLANSGGKVDWRSNSHEQYIHNPERSRPENEQFKQSKLPYINESSSHNLLNNREIGQSFTRLVEQIQKDQMQEQDIDTDIQIRDIDYPNLPPCPTISMNQDQLIQLAQKTFKIFGIEVSSDDYDFTMKKYKNCVILNKGAETILWHYTGKFYMGGWKVKQNGQGQKTGEGIQIIPEKHIYKGQFKNGKKHGNGILKSENGNIYDGQWIEGVKNGQGIYYDSTTKVAYRGQFKNGKKNGFGLLKFSQKQYYQGTFIKSVKDGYGLQVFVNGDRYKGQYRKGKFHGKGKYIWSNGSCYQGDFIEGMRHGNGSWKSSKQHFDIYVGTYFEDKKSGYGRYVWANGCIYEGNFAEDVKHGKGRLIYTDGKQIKGVWEQGALIEANSQKKYSNHQDQKLKNPSMKLSFGVQKKIQT